MNHPNFNALTGVYSYGTGNTLRKKESISINVNCYWLNIFVSAVGNLEYTKIGSFASMYFVFFCIRTNWRIKPVSTDATVYSYVVLSQQFPIVVMLVEWLSRWQTCSTSHRSVCAWTNLMVYIYSVLVNTFWHIGLSFKEFTEIRYFYRFYRLNLVIFWSFIKF